MPPPGLQKVCAVKASSGSRALRLCERNGSRVLREKAAEIAFAVRNCIAFSDEERSRLGGMLSDALCGVGMKNEYADPVRLRE